MFYSVLVRFFYSILFYVVFEHVLINVFLYLRISVQFLLDSFYYPCPIVFYFNHFTFSFYYNVFTDSILLNCMVAFWRGVLGLVGRSDQPPYFYAQLLPVSANPSLLMYPRCPSDSLKYSINTCLSLCSFASLSAVFFACSSLFASTDFTTCKSSCTTTVNLSIFINLLFLSVALSTC